MKSLLKNIWDAPATTMAGALVAGLTYVQIAEVDLAPWVSVAIGATAALLAVFSGPNK